jgi:hypothetical protein
MDKATLIAIKTAVFDSFQVAFCYGLTERLTAMLADGIPTGLEMGQVVIVLLLITSLSFLNPRSNHGNTH